MIIKEASTPAYQAIFNSFNLALFGRTHTPMNKTICGGDGESEEELEDYRSRLKKGHSPDRPNANNIPDTESAKDSSSPAPLSLRVPLPFLSPTHTDGTPGEEFPKDSPSLPSPSPHIPVSHVRPTPLSTTPDEPKPDEDHSEPEEDHSKPKKRPAPKKKTKVVAIDGPSDNLEATSRSTRGGNSKKGGNKTTEETDGNRNTTRQLRNRG